MNSSIQFIGLSLLAFSVLFIVSCILWRYASRYFYLPCPSWVAWILEINIPFARTHRAEIILSLANLREGMTVLDVGCGPGRLLVPAAKMVGQTGFVIGLDMQIGMIERAQKKLTALGIKNTKCIQGNISEYSLETELYDRVFISAVLGEIPDQAAALRQVYFCLKPGGLLLISEVYFDPHYQSQTKVKALAEDAGLMFESIHGNKLSYTACFSK